jgi:hypothetical protein
LFDLIAVADGELFRLPIDAFQKRQALFEFLHHRRGPGLSQLAKRFLPARQQLQATLAGCKYRIRPGWRKRRAMPLMLGQ